jgi:hypothetical protein
MFFSLFSSIRRLKCVLCLNSGYSPLRRRSFTVIESFDIRSLMCSQHHCLKHSHPRYYILRSSSPKFPAFFCTVFSYPYFRCFPVLHFPFFIFSLLSFIPYWIFIFPPPVPTFSFILFVSFGVFGSYFVSCNRKTSLLWRT